MIRSVTRSQQRRGLSVTETAVILGVIAVAVVIGALLLGGRTATRIQDTATDVGNPHELKHFFDDMSSSS